MSTTASVVNDQPYGIYIDGGPNPASASFTIRHNVTVTGTNTEEGVQLTRLGETNLALASGATLSVSRNNPSLDYWLENPLYGVLAEDPGSRIKKLDIAGTIIVAGSASTGGQSQNVIGILANNVESINHSGTLNVSTAGGADYGGYAAGIVVVGEAAGTIVTTKPVSATGGDGVTNNGGDAWGLYVETLTGTGSISGTWAATGGQSDEYGGNAYGITSIDNRGIFRDAIGIAEGGRGIVGGGGIAVGVSTDRFFGDNSLSAEAIGGESPNGYGGDATGIYVQDGVDGTLALFRDLTAQGGNGTWGGNATGIYLNELSGTLNVDRAVTATGGSGEYGGYASGIGIDSLTGTLAFNSTNGNVTAVGGTGDLGGAAYAVWTGTVAADVDFSSTILAIGGDGDVSGGDAYGLSIDRLDSRLTVSGSISALGGVGNVNNGTDDGIGGAATGIDIVDSTGGEINITGTVTAVGGNGLASSIIPVEWGADGGDAIGINVETAGTINVNGMVEATGGGGAFWRTDGNATGLNVGIAEGPIVVATGKSVTATGADGEFGADGRGMAVETLRNTGSIFIEGTVSGIGGSGMLGGSGYGLTVDSAEGLVHVAATGLIEANGGTATGIDLGTLTSIGELRIDGTVTADGFISAQGVNVKELNGGVNLRGEVAATAQFADAVHVDSFGTNGVVTVLPGAAITAENTTVGFGSALGISTGVPGGADTVSGLIVLQGGTIKARHTDGSLGSDLSVDSSYSMLGNAEIAMFGANDTLRFDPGTGNVFNHGGNPLRLYGTEKIDFGSGTTLWAANWKVMRQDAALPSSSYQATVMDGATLTGNGTINVDQAAIRNGGTISPGNAVGVIGKLDFGSATMTFEAGSKYVVDVDSAKNYDPTNPNDADSDRIVTGGNVTVAQTNTTLDVYVNSLLPEGTTRKYLIIESTYGSVDNTFTDIAYRAGAQLSQLIDTDGNLYLVLEGGYTPFALPLCYNPQEAASALNRIMADDRVAPLGNLGIALMNLDPTNRNQVGSAFRQLHGEVFATGQEAAVQMQRQFVDILPSSGGTIPMVGQRNSLWGTLTGNWDSRSDIHDHCFSAYKLRSVGVAVGWDRYVSERFFVGAAFGYDYGAQTFDTIRSRADIEAFRVMTYGGYRNGSWFVDGYAGYTKDWHKTRRDINISPFASVARAKYDDNMFSTGFEVGRHFHFGATTLVPTIGLHYTYLGSPRIRESGGREANLTVDSGQYASFRLPVGGRLSTDIDGAWLIWRPEIRAFYVREMDGETAEVCTRFSAVPETSFRAQSGQWGRNGGQFGIGLSANLDYRFSFGVNYDYEIWEQTNRHNIGVVLSARW